MTYVVIGYLVLLGALAISGTGIFGAGKKGTGGPQPLNGAADVQARAHVNEALGVLAGDYEVFHNYSVTNPVGIKFTDHRLRSVASLTRIRQ